MSSALAYGPCFLTFRAIPTRLPLLSLACATLPGARTGWWYHSLPRLASPLDVDSTRTRLFWRRLLGTQPTSGPSSTHSTQLTGSFRDPFTQLYFFPVSPLRTRDVLNLKSASCGVFTPPWVAGLGLQRVGGEGVWEEKAPSSFQSSAFRSPLNTAPSSSSGPSRSLGNHSWDVGIVWRFQELAFSSVSHRSSGAEQGRSLLSP